MIEATFIALLLLMPYAFWIIVKDWRGFNAMESRFNRIYILIYLGIGFLWFISQLIFIGNNL